MKGFIPTYSTIDTTRTEPTGFIRKSHISHIRIAKMEAFEKVWFYLKAEIRGIEYKISLDFKTKEEVEEILEKLFK